MQLLLNVSLMVARSSNKHQACLGIKSLLVNIIYDSRCGSASLSPWEKHLMLFSTLRPSSLPVVVAQPDERYANRTASVLKWYDRHRA